MGVDGFDGGGGPLHGKQAMISLQRMADESFFRD